VDDACQILNQISVINDQQARHIGNKPKICILVHTLMKGGGGTASLRLFLKHLSKKPVDIFLVTGPEIDVDINSYGGALKWKCLPNLRRPVSVLKDLHVLMELWRLFRKERFDLLHTNYAKPGVLGRIAGRLAEIPIIVHHIYGCTFNETYTPFFRLTNALIERFLSKWTDHYIFVGNDIFNRYKRTNVIRDGRYSIVYPAMDLTSFIRASIDQAGIREKKRAELGLGESEFAIGMVARFVPGKGHSEALKVMHALKIIHPDAKLFLVGRGPLQEKVAQQIKKKGLQESVKILGYRNDLEALMVSWDAGLFTSFGEGMPQVLIQMVLVGLPVVTFAVDGSRELIEDGKTGFIVPVGDTETMIERLRYLIDNKELFRPISCKQGVAVSPKWNPEYMNNKLYEIYTYLLQKK